MKRIYSPLLVLSVACMLLSCEKSQEQNKDNKTDTTQSKSKEEAPKVDSTALIIKSFEATPFFSYTDTNAVFLSKFFESLKDESQSHHILYYGDSQIEGDLITNHVRDSLRKSYAGKGVGFIDFDDIAYNLNASRHRSPNWYRQTFFKKKRNDGKYGIGGSTSSYNGDNAWVNFNLYKHFLFDKVSLIYQHPHDKVCTLTVSDSKTGKVLKTLKLSKNDLPEKVDLLVGLNHRNIRLQFDGPSPLLAGIFVDGHKGLQVDNFGMRGHAGYGLLNIKDKWLEKQASLLNASLVVLAYGANEAIYIDNAKELQAFREGHQKLIDKVKKNIPEASILIVSVGEMGNRRTGQPHHYMAQVRDVQKELAQKNGCAFWDVLAMMQEGGENWRQSGLRAFDGHFSAKGQKRIGFGLAHLLTTAGQNYNKLK